MNTRTLISRQALPVVIGQILCVSAMLGVFLLTGSLDSRVIRGGIAGALISLGNFLFMAFFACLAADKAARQDVAGGQKLLRLSYLGRMVLLSACLIVFANSGQVHVLALCLPLLFIRPILTVLELFSRKGGN